MNGFIKKYPLLVLMFVSLLMLLPHLDAIQTNIMEARNLVTAREMVNNGHWIFTTLNNLPRYEKPPLPTWITALFGAVGGFGSLFWLRLPVVLITLLLVYFFYRLMKAIKPGDNQPLHASLILITSFYIFFGGRDNQWDIYTHAFMVAAIFFMVKAFRQPDGTAKNIILSGLFFGCSFLSKGPVSLYALFLPFVVAYFFIYKEAYKKNLRLLLLMVIIGLIIGFSWFVYVRLFDTSNVHAALDQESGRWGKYEVKPFWYYWSFFTQSGIWTVPAFVSLLYFYMRRRVKDVKAYQLSFWWTILSLVLLSCIPEKKVRYVEPVLIPLAMNTSFYIEYLIDNFKTLTQKLDKCIALFTFGLVGIVALAVPVVLFFILKGSVGDYIIWYGLLSLASLFCGIMIIKGLYKKRFENVFYAVVFYMCAVVITLIPLSKFFYSNPAYYSAASLRAIEKSLNIKTYEVNGFIPEIIWDYGNSIPEITGKDSTVTMPRDSLFGLLMNEGDLPALQQNYKGYQFDKKASIDINAMRRGKKGYSTRLVKEYYVVRKLR